MTKDPDLKVWRCLKCGDTFPAGSSAVTCPSCGATDVEAAREPLL